MQYLSSSKEPGVLHYLGPGDRCCLTTDVCCWLLEAYGVDAMRKQKRKAHGYRLRRLILNEFRNELEPGESAITAPPAPLFRAKASLRSSPMFRTAQYVILWIDPVRQCEDRVIRWKL
uniref:Uncharacterized protein n=1 Tax=Parascaris equorum TaxID=6256 RepID=A0A914R9E5_PAREQ